MKQVVDVPLRLGRPSNNVKTGVVGLPNVGKSSLFNILCGMEVAAENYPFCTIDPTVSRVPVPDERFTWLCDNWKPAKEIPAYLSVTDIAGIIKGASEGEGLGNAFLSHISACDAIFHVVRVFEDADILHVDDSVDPLRDIQTIAQELRFKDMAFLSAQVTKLASVVERVDKTKKFDLETTQKALDLLESGKDIRHSAWAAKEIEVLNEYMLLTAKPVIFLLNLSSKDYIRKKNKWLGKIVTALREDCPGDVCIPMSVPFEAELLEMGPEEAEAFCAENKVKSALPKMITEGYKALGLINFFTTGKDEVRAWTMREHTKAPQAAGVIHGDFEKFFIKVEVTPYEDYHTYGSAAATAAAGKVQDRGKEYVVKNGDILVFKHGAGGAGKKK